LPKIKLIGVKKRENAMKKIISLDMGDTLIAFTPRRYELIHETLKDHGYSFSLEQVYRKYIKTMAKHHFPDPHGVNPFDVREFLYELGLNPTDEKLVKEISKAGRGEEVDLFDDTIEFLEYVKKEGYSVVLVSNATPRGKEVFEKFGLRKYFDLTVFSFEVGLVKPNPRIFSLVTRQIGKPLVHVGDIYEMDVVGARNAGINAVLLNRFGFYKEGIKTLRDLEKLEIQK